MSEHEPRALQTEKENAALILEETPEEDRIHETPEAVVSVIGLTEAIPHERQTRARSADRDTDEAPEPTPKPFKPGRINDIKAQRIINKENKAEVLIKSDNHTLEKIWGKDVGSDEFRDNIKTMRRSLRRHARRAHKKYNKNAKKSESLIDSAQKASENLIPTEDSSQKKRSRSIKKTGRHTTDIPAPKDPHSIFNAEPYKSDVTGLAYGTASKKATDARVAYTEWRNNRVAARAARLAQSVIAEDNASVTQPKTSLDQRYFKALDKLDKYEARLLKLKAKQVEKEALLDAKKSQFNDPDFYFDAAKMLKLKQDISRETERRISFAVADTLDRGDDITTVSQSKIETATMLEGIARYFGFRTWDEAEEKVPGWLMDGVMQLYGYSEQELEAEAEREQRPTTRNRSQQPQELTHDEPIHLHDEDDGIDSYQMADAPELLEDEPVEQFDDSHNQLEEIVNPEHDPYADYEQKIRAMALQIDAAIEEQTEGITNPGEKRNIVDAVYREAIADFFGMSEEDLANDTGVPKELLNQVVSDIKTARREIDQNETEAAKRIAYNVAQRVSFRLAGETRGKNLTEKERDDLKLNLFLETLANEFSVTPEELDNPKFVSQRLKKKALARIDQNEKERLDRVAKMHAEEAAKTPEQRKTDAGNDQLDKLRNTIND